MPILNMNYVINQGGTNIGEPSDLVVTFSGSDATITWTDNDLNTIPPSTFSKSVLVRKIGSAPTTPTDGTLVVTETVKNTYKTIGYVDSGLTDGETYYYKVFSYSDSGGITYCDAVYAWEYTYDFKGNNMTQVVADGWTDTSGWQIDSGGLWRNSWTSMKKTLPDTLTNAKKITMTGVLYVRKSTGTQDILYRITNGNFANECGMSFGGQNNDNYVAYGGNQSTYTYTYTGEATFVYAYDLVNKTVTVSSTGGTTTPNTFTMTDTDIANIRSNTTIEIRQNGASTRIASIGIKVEY